MDESSCSKLRPCSYIGAHQNCMEQMKELIVQNCNHPSIMFWGISEQLAANHKELNAFDLVD